MRTDGEQCGDERSHGAAALWRGAAFFNAIIKLISIDEPCQAETDREGDKEASAVVKSSHCF